MESLINKAKEKQKELQEKLDAYFYKIAEDVAKTHTGALKKGSKYAKFIEEYKKKKEKG